MADLMFALGFAMADLMFALGLAAGFLAAGFLAEGLSAIIGPPVKNPGISPFLFTKFSKSNPSLLALDDLMTYSPSESIAGIESDVEVPGPETNPPVESGTSAGPPPTPAPPPGPVGD